MIAIGDSILKWNDDASVGGSEFSGCVPYLETLATCVNQSTGVTYIFVDEIIDPADSSFYDDDQIHPSVTGSAAMARLLADAIRASELEP